MARYFKLAFVGDCLCGACELNDEIADAVEREAPEDVYELWEDWGFVEIVECTHDELPDRRCVYSGTEYGWLPTDETGRHYRFAYEVA